MNGRKNTLEEIETQPCVCGDLKATFWVMLFDEYRDKYFYPLRDAGFCPVCGEVLKGQIDGLTTD